jgi:hypothetical protein
MLSRAVMRSFQVGLVWRWGKYSSGGYTCGVDLIAFMRKPVI